MHHPYLIPHFFGVEEILYEKIYPYYRLLVGRAHGGILNKLCF